MQANTQQAMILNEKEIFSLLLKKEFLKAMILIKEGLKNNDHDLGEISLNVYINLTKEPEHYNDEDSKLVKNLIIFAQMFKITLPVAIEEAYNELLLKLLAEDPDSLKLERLKRISEQIIAAAAAENTPSSDILKNAEQAAITMLTEAYKQVINTLTEKEKFLKALYKAQKGESYGCKDLLLPTFDRCIPDENWQSLVFYLKILNDDNLVFEKTLSMQSYFLQPGCSFLKNETKLKSLLDCLTICNSHPDVQEAKLAIFINLTGLNRANY